MPDVLIIDDCIPVDKQIELEKLCLSVEYPWFYHENTAYRFDNSNTATSTNARESLMFAHSLWTEYGRNSMFFGLFIPVIDAIPYKIEKILRAKTSLNLPFSGQTSNTHSPPHVDLMDTEQDFITAIYYVNDSDGDTVIFNESQGFVGEVTVKQRIQPKRGRLVVFPGNMLHAGNNPSKDKPRITLNVNLIPL